MCCEETRCERPKELKGKPETCSAKQVKKCHGGVKEHPCAEAKTRKKSK